MLFLSSSSSLYGFLFSVFFTKYLALSKMYMRVFQIFTLSLVISSTPSKIPLEISVYQVTRFGWISPQIKSTWQLGPLGTYLLKSWSTWYTSFGSGTNSSSLSYCLISWLLLSLNPMQMSWPNLTSKCINRGQSWTENVSSEEKHLAKMTKSMFWFYRLILWMNHLRANGLPSYKQSESCLHRLLQRSKKTFKMDKKNLRIRSN